jgi:hypothetical protein
VNNVYEKSKDALARIYASCGIDMLLGPELKRNIADYYYCSAEPMGAAKLLIIRYVHERGCAKILRESITASDADKGIAIKKSVEALAGFDKDLCQIVIGEFAEVLGWKIGAQAPAQQPQTQASAPQKQQTHAPPEQSLREQLGIDMTGLIGYIGKSPNR